MSQSNPSTTPVIEVDELHKRLGGEDVLRGVNLDVDQGDIISLVGASGSGKSVLLRNIVGLMRPDSGSVRINDQNVHELSSRRLTALRDSIGMLFQNGALFDSMTVFENLAFPLREKTDMNAETIRERISNRLELVGLSGTEEKYPAELSGGMQKRVALARSLILNPDIIFFDEPTTGLDPIIANSILRLIHDLHDEFDFTSVIVSHNFDKVFDIVSHVAMLHDGKIHAHQPPSDFMESDDEIVQNFVNEAIKGPLEATSDGTSH